MAVFRVGDRIYGSAEGKHPFVRKKIKSEDVTEIDRTVRKIRLHIKRLGVDLRRIGRQMKDPSASTLPEYAQLSEEELSVIEESLRNEKAELEKEAEEWLEYRNELQDCANYPQRRFRKKYRKVPEEKAETAVTGYIERLKDKGENRVTAEEISSACRISKGQVCVVLHRLNLARVLSQKERCFAHDTYRNPVFDGAVSGWGANVYYIL